MTMRLFYLPTGILDEDDRTWWLMPPFDLIIQAMIAARGRVTIGARIDGDEVCTDARIDGRTTITARTDAEIITWV